LFACAEGFTGTAMASDVDSGTVKTFCRNCGAQCSMEVDVEDGRLVRARPDATASPYGGYMCPKGLAAIDIHNGTEPRLLSTLRRTAACDHVEMPAEAALDAIAEKLSALLREHGPRAIAVYHGTGAYRSVLGGMLERAWVSEIGTPNFFSSMTIDQSAKWVTMARLGVMASGKHAMRDADVVLLAGGNPVVSHQGVPFAVAETGAPGRAFETAKARGCRIIIVDPRRTETARYADLLIQPLPGHDATIFAAIAHVLLRDDRIDHAFCARWCIQLDALRAAVAPFTPELAAGRADVPVEQIEQAARWLGEARRPLMGSGTGPSMADHSNLADHMIEAVNALVGGFRRSGDLVRNSGTLRRKKIYELAVSPSRSFAHEPKCLSEDAGPLMGELPTALLPREIMTDSPDRIRALIVFGGDPLMALGDPAVAKPAFEALDLLVSLDCRQNETGKLADYVVATTQQFERPEITASGDSMYPVPFVQYTPAIVPPPPGVIHDWEFFWGVAARMGLPLTLKYWQYGLRYADMAGGLPLDMAQKPDADDLLRFLCRESTVDFDTLRASPGGVRPEDGASRVLPPPGDGGRLELCPGDVAAELAAVLATAPSSDYRFRLTCRRIPETVNSAFRHSVRARRRHPLNYVHMNAQDMASAGIVDDSLVEIRSPSGTARTFARADERLRPGVVSMTHMFGTLIGSGDPVADGGANVGQLTSLTADLQPINFMPRFSAIPVEITPIVDRGLEAETSLSSLSPASAERHPSR
jgi:anaerobic selenocysteine-containing dehydrogenase